MASVAAVGADVPVRVEVRKLAALKSLYCICSHAERQKDEVFESTRPNLEIQVHVHRVQPATYTECCRPLIYVSSLTSVKIGMLSGMPSSSLD